MSNFRALRFPARRPVDPDLAPLRIRSCRDLCEWTRTPVERRDEPMFACRGCGSQWVPSESWTPRDSNGAVPLEVRHILTAEP